MLAYRFNQTLFTHVIAANSRADALRIATDANQVGAYTVEQWHTPDVWTRRAVDMALAPGVIDTIPRFVVERKDGPVYLDIDDVPTKLTHNERIKTDDDSGTHCTWAMACHAERERGALLHSWMRYVVGKQHDTTYYNALIRATAGAWGLGPIPEWHAAILPALIALDIESANRGYALADNVFELEREELWQHLHAQLPDSDDDINHLVELIARGTNLSLREYAKRTMVSLGWLR